MPWTVAGASPRPALREAARTGDIPKLKSLLEAATTDDINAADHVGAGPHILLGRSYYRVAQGQGTM